MLSQNRSSSAIQKTRDFYTMRKGAPFLQQEFGFYCLDRWISEGHIKIGEDLDALFGYDGYGWEVCGRLGWCEAEFIPRFEEKILVDRGEYELVQDYAGRQVLYFKNRRQGFMPEYMVHPVKDTDSWECNVKWRLDPKAEGRFDGLPEHMAHLQEKASQGMYMIQNMIGGYMYLRSLVGPEDIMYMVYDNPELIHDMMRVWFILADSVIERHQNYITLDELFLAEDICFNHGPLISPDMIREFLFPYYQQLIINIKRRQIDKTRHLHIQVDTDGDCRPLIPVYQEIGLDSMSPFEAASGCDVVEIRRQYPQLLMRGGFDKRILAAGQDAIDREVERIMPFMKDQGGYIPMCDHGVPEEVSFENYMHYRKRMLEY